MNSDARNRCSHRLGFPIRKSPDHSLLAASRSLSQLIASFIAYLRQGIHTHALSSLTIKSTSPATQPAQSSGRPGLPYTCRRYFYALAPVSGCRIQNLCFVMPVKYSIVKEQESSQLLAISFQLRALNLTAESC
jgi:hypothetical protein